MDAARSFVRLLWHFIAGQKSDTAICKLISINHDEFREGQTKNILYLSDVEKDLRQTYKNLAKQRSDIAIFKLILINCDEELVGSDPSFSCSMQNYKAGGEKTSCIYQVSKKISGKQTKAWQIEQAGGTLIL